MGNSEVSGDLAGIRLDCGDMPAHFGSFMPSQLLQVSKLRSCSLFAFAGELSSCFFVFIQCKVQKKARPISFYYIFFFNFIFPYFTEQ